MEVDFVSLERIFVPTSSRCEVAALAPKHIVFAVERDSKTPPAEFDKSME
jgi:hypothetical protein